MSKFIKWIVVILVICSSAYLLAEWKMKNEVVSFLEHKVPKHIDFTYDKITVNLFKGNIAFKDVTVVSLGKQTSSCEIKVDTDELSIEGFSYWKILFQKSIFIKTLTLTKPHLNFKTCPKDTDNVVANKSNPINLLKEIFVQNLIFDSGIVEIWDATKQLELISVQKINLSLKEVATNPDIITKYVPFTFSEYNIEIQKFNAPLGDFEALEMESMVIDNSNIDITNISLSTIYSKSELSKEITYQRDYIDLTIPSINVENHNYLVSNDSLQVNFKELFLTKPKLEMYRDKSRLEDFRNKPLYGELLRKLPFKVAIDSVFIEKGSIIYEEDIPNNVKAGALSFENLDATISNLSNLVNVEDPLKIHLNANLMGVGKFHLDWEFDVQDLQNTFLISGGLSNFNTANLNDFIVPNLRTQTTGTIDQLYFTISGDDNVATGDIKMSYEDFKFQVMNKERNGIKKVLSFIGNLFVNDGSKADVHGYRYGDINVERVKNKSFFNYLWINLQDGLVDVLTGNGKKD
ncbi:hypothetical protein LCGC14_0070970 [marine sediment metagenome]|uniref:AsmA domain-containing protein n=1 Tax=marine sediment metagenome TaxID=412755 RepID=A0A0F9YN66_9ZZZZ|nr:hypothetical protein [Maribacter sp.]HDZ05449.1 hypothetical protein [Maribacter sp.]HEA80358.1 hypothetical protein [Maribacter sp.]